MTAGEFEAVVHATGDGPIVALRGVVNRSAQTAMDAAYREASQTPGEIVLDFGDVTYINSTGIAVIVGVLKMARSEDRSVAAVGLTDHYREVFEITRLADFMDIHHPTPSGN